MKTGRIVARPYPLFTAIGGVCAAFFLILPVAVALGTAGDPSRRLDDAMAAVVAFFLPGLPLLWWFAYCSVARVVADANGISWRTGWRFWRWQWQMASWDAVSDLYLDETACGIIRLTDGRAIALQPDMSGLPRLREFIARHAARADPTCLPDGSRGWTQKGIRPAELPLVCTYDAAHLAKGRRGNRRAFLVGTLVLMAMATATTFLPFAETTNPRSDPADGLLLLATVYAVLFGIVFPVGIGFSWWGADRVYAAAQECAKRGERFRLAPDGLTFTVGGEGRFVPWQEVVGWEFGIGRRRGNGRPYIESARIRTAHGQEFTVSSLIENYTLLRAALPLYATEGIEYRLTRNTNDALGGVAWRWTGGEEGIGDRVFHARTRGNVFGMGLAIGLGAVLLVLPPLSLYLRYGGFFGLERLFPLYLLCLAAVVAWYAWVWRAQVLVGKAGFTLVGLGRPRSLRWEEIERIVTDGPVVIEGSEGTILEIIPARYAYGSELPALITETWERARRAQGR